MSAASVAFIVPTLNRKGYVTRAVRSCLAALAAAGGNGQVVVLDSQSDDGSWEELEEQFSATSNVALRQNQRGLGPLRSWLDGADGVQADRVTFVWSDDYLAQSFLATLLPAMADGATLAIGRGLVRPVDCTDPLPAAGSRQDQDAQTLLLAYLGVRGVGQPKVPVSPACALFAGSAFAHWQAVVGTLSQATPLRTQFMWRRAIGPDMLLFMIALADQGCGPVPVTTVPVAQFSAHEDSITVSSSPWTITLGYWLARTTFLTDDALIARIDARARALAYSRCLLQGYLLKRAMIAQVPSFARREDAQAAMRHELALLRRAAFRHAGKLAIVHGLAVAVRQGLRERRQ